MVLGTVACSREAVVEQPETGRMTVSASIADESTRTALQQDGEVYKVVWSKGDKILISGEEFTLVGEGGSSSGEFEGPQLEDGEYEAYFATTDGSIPTTQTCTPGRIGNAPMVAALTVSDGRPGPMSFRNLGGLLRLSIKNIQKAPVKSITFYGNISVSSTSIVLDCGEDGVALSEEGTEFFIAMPEGEYNGVRIAVSDGKETITKGLAAKRTFDIYRSEITDASFTVNFSGKYPTYHMGHEYIDLGLSSGLKWAACNLGADEPWENGGVYAWQDADIDWGGDWRMPTLDELNELLKEADWVMNYHPDNRSVHGYAARKNSKYIFFPDGIYYNGEDKRDYVGYYWSSTDSDGYPYAMMLTGDPLIPNNCLQVYPHYLFSVRPVLEIKK